MDGIISIIKLNDTILQKIALKYYEQIIDLEMEMRSVLTYIITYNGKTINDELFKNFGINKSEKIEFDSIKKEI